MQSSSLLSPAPDYATPAVAAAFAAFPDSARAGLLRLRALIFDLAAETPAVGPLQETLKWGQPAYLTPETRAGSTVRLGVPKGGGFALYVHCQTTIVSEFRQVFPTDFAYDGNRGVLFEKDPPPNAIAPLIRRALTYHLR
ncbi:MAG: DUF1801 domain-containing protein [Pseudomonadota bacterium]